VALAAKAKRPHVRQWAAALLERGEAGQGVAARPEEKAKVEDTVSSTLD
jgi:hypothetical protein